MIDLRGDLDLAEQVGQLVPLAIERVELGRQLLDDGLAQGARRHVAGQRPCLGYIAAKFLRRVLRQTGECFVNRVPGCRTWERRF
jgi:hypothetical protein